MSALVLLSGYYGVRALSYFSGPLLFDEWYCSSGQAPTMYEGEFGSRCVADGEKLRPGEKLQPLGNRPFDCGNRHGWVQVKRPATVPGEIVETDCWPDGTPLSEAARAEGWTFDEANNRRRGWF